MRVSGLVSALPPNSNTGWGVASRRITEELGKMAFVHDIRHSGYVCSDIPITFNVPVIQAITGVTMMPMYPHIRGTRNIGYCFIEQTELARNYLDNVPRYFDYIVCGSDWARRKIQILLDSSDISTHVRTAIQGVDLDSFCQGPVPETDPKWFTVWSAGKFEFRKGQDVVLRAMQVMIERYKDVRLICAWSNPWPSSQETMSQSALIEYNGSLIDTVCKYLPQDRVEMLPPMEHYAAADFMERCDVALFCNRLEAGTNLPLMEAMAMELPLVTTNKHGHGTVVPDNFSFIYDSEKKPWIGQGGNNTGEIYEPNLESVITCLEVAYQQWRQGTLRERGEHARRYAKQFTWQNCAKQFLSIVEES